MDWTRKLEMKYRRFAIKGILNYVIAGQVLVFGIVLLINQNLPLQLMFFTPYILQGEIWRIITFIFLPSSYSFIWFPISAMFYYFIGMQLEHSWGEFKLNLYFWLSVIGSICAGALVGYTDNSALLSALFLAYAMLYPNRSVMLMMVIEVKVAWLGYAAGAFWLYNFIMASWQGKISLVFGMLGFIVFFGPTLFKTIRAYIRRQIWRNKNR